MNKGLHRIEEYNVQRKRTSNLDMGKKVKRCWLLHGKIIEGYWRNVLWRGSIWNYIQLIKLCWWGRRGIRRFTRSTVKHFWWKKNNKMFSENIWNPRNSHFLAYRYSCEVVLNCQIDRCTSYGWNKLFNLKITTS